MAIELPSNYFRHQKRFLSKLGVSFDGDGDIYYKMYTILIVVTMFVTYGVLEVMEAYYNFDDEDTFVSVLSYLGTDLVGLIKLYILLYYRKDIEAMLNRFETGVFLPNIERGGMYEVEVVKRYVAISNAQAYLYQFFCNMVLLLGIIGTLYERIMNPDDTSKWNMPFLPFSLIETKSPYYEIAWFYQGAIRFIYCIFVSTTDTLLGAILAHISAQCLLVQNSIKRMIENAYKDVVKMEPSLDKKYKDPKEIDASLIPYEILEVHLKGVIHYHWKLLDLAEKFEEIFSVLILFEFLATLCILCFTMYHASTFSLFSRQAGQDFSYVAAISVQVFLCCFWGNEVTLQSQSIAEACCEMNYVGTDLRFQKNLILMIRRCQKPVVLTAAKFTDLSLRTYMWLIRASYSYYMVLRSRE